MHLITGGGAPLYRQTPGYRRLLGVVGAFLALTVIAALLLNREETRVFSSDERAIGEMADEVGAAILEHLQRGYVEGVSGEISLVPIPNRYIAGRWDLRSLASDSPSTVTSHSNPWASSARVPLILYGPELLPSGRTVDAEADLASLAPTYAMLLGMEGFEADAQPLPGLPRKEVPAKLIFTVVIDGGGWNVLQQHPQSWPNIRRLMESGVSYFEMDIGSAPSITGAIHTTLGTGFYPRTAGVPSNPTWSPENLKVPTVSELWDEANGNSALVAAIAYDSFHLGMVGHGTQREGGDADIGVLWDSEEHRWRIDQETFTLPTYLSTTDIDTLRRYEEELDARDGLEDGTWFGNHVEDIRRPLVRPGSPAFARFHGDAVGAILDNESMGADEIADFMWVEMKMPDHAGHTWNMLRPEVGDVLAEVDRQVGIFQRALDAKVGAGNYVLAITADHGQQPLADSVGGWRIDSAELEADLEEEFGDIIDKVQTFQLDVNMDALSDSDYTLRDIARFVGAYKLGDNVGEGLPGSDLVPEGRRKERLFAGAFPGSFLQQLGPDELEEYGQSAYPEGRL